MVFLSVFKNLTIIFVTFFLFQGGSGALASLKQYPSEGQDFSWQNNYYGQPTFRLEQDDRLARTREHARRERRRLVDHKNRRDILESDLRSSRRRIRRHRKKIQDIDNRISTIEQARRDVTTLEGQLSRAESEHRQKKQEMDDMWRKWGQVKGRKQRSDAQVAQARRHYWNVWQTCQGEKTSSECKSDPNVREAERRLREKERENRAIAQEEVRVAQRARAVESQVHQALRRKDQIAQRLQRAKSLAANGYNRIRELQHKRNKTRRAIQDKQLHCRQLESRIYSLNHKISQLREYYRRAREEERTVHRQLVREITERNSSGHGKGSAVGSRDGLQLAQQLGESSGRVDGERDGREKGVKEGRARDYKRGYDEGLRVGEQRARTQGEADGRRLGREEGNGLVGQKEGQADGVKRAEASDARQVGRTQGQAEGLKRATEDGRRLGGAMGEKRAIGQHESQVLQSVVVDAPFVGTFSSGLPPYQAGSGVSYELKAFCNGQRYLVQLACLDGLEYGYNQSRRQSYSENIGSSYNRAYATASAQAYEQAFSAIYDQSYQSGLSQGEREKFDHLYPQIKERFQVQERQLALVSPDRQSFEYRNAFETTTLASYLTRYEELRFTTFDLAKKEAYQQNIESQKQHFTQVRYDEVVALYQGHSVLQYMGSSAHDNGVEGVGAGDGIYQPGEQVVYDVVIRNYGHRAAQGAILQTAGGVVRQLPSLPGRSVVRVRRALTTTVPNTVGQQFSLGVIATKSLGSVETVIEGRHYYNASSGQLNALEKIFVQVSYPLEAGVLVEGPLVLGTEATYHLSVKNISKLAYEGSIEFQVTTSKGSGVLSSAPPSLSRLSSGETGRVQGRVLIQDENSALEHLTFQVTVVTKGVVVGEVQGAGEKLVQIGYKGSGARPLVLLGDGERDPQTLLDTLAELGGLEKVSVWDASLNQKDMLTPSALSGKFVVLATRELDQRTKTVLAQLAVTTPKVIVVGQSEYDHLLSLRQLPLMNLSVDQTILIPNEQGDIPVSLTFANQYAHSSLQGEGGVVVFEAKSMEDILGFQDRTFGFFLDHENLIEQALDAMEQEDVAQALETKVVLPQHRTPIQALLSAIVVDALKINTYYYSNKSAGKKVIRRVNKDPRSLLNHTLTLLGDALKEGNVERMITGIMVLEELRKLISSHDVLSDMTGKIKRSMASRSDRMTDRLHSSLERRKRIFYRKFVGMRKTNRLLGSFQPIH